jgi:hypothetical protein
MLPDYPPGSFLEMVFSEIRTFWKREPVVTGWMAVAVCQEIDKAEFPQLSDFHTLKLYHATTGGTNEVGFKETHPLCPPAE